MNNLRKLLHRDKVEVRQLEEGLWGSWHSGVVVGVSESCLDVRYNDLLCESGTSKLVESIPVTGAIEGLYQRPYVKSNYRGRIRPLPPHSELCSVNLGLKFGVCVDVLYNEAWWEGVIFDYDDGAKERRVYFPDEDDELLYKLSDIRVTLEWDEFYGNWRERGTWQLVDLAREHKKDDNLSQFIRRVWSRLKVHYGYQKMISEWTCGAYSVWKEYFREVICDITSTPRAKVVISSPGSHRRVTKKKSSRSKKNVSVLTRSMQSKKDQELSLSVKTRLMCMSEPEDSSIFAATKGRDLADSQCRQNCSAAVDSCVTTDSPKADVSRKYDQAPSVFYFHVSDSDTEKEEHPHGGTSPISVLDNKIPSCYRSNSNIPVKHRSRRKWHFIENCLTPVKRKPSKIKSCQRQLSNGSKMTSQASSNDSLKVFDYKSVDTREGLIQTQKKVGFTVRYSVLERGRGRISRHRLRKNRSHLRIKHTSSKKSEDNDKPKPILSETLEEAKSSQKEDDVLDRDCETTLPAADSCQELESDYALTTNIRRARRRTCRDSVCFICQYGGDELLHCYRCMSSYHFSCVHLERDTSGKFLCPSCRCGLCLEICASGAQLLSDICYQCSRQYHLACLDQAGVSVSEDTRFCRTSCFEICARLHQLLRISNPTSVEGLSWSITRSRRNDCNVYNERVHPLIQVSQVLNVFHECFQPIKEPHTGRDLVADIVYNSGSKFRRLDFHGFYVMALVNADEVVCAATIRIYGQKVAEMPLIATPFKYRRQGMCRLLLQELEKMLAELGVERLVLPGIASLSETWVSSFGFTEMPTSVRRELLGYPFVEFKGTTLFQKNLNRSFEVPGNAGLCTPETIKSNECAPSPSSECAPCPSPSNECAPSPSRECAPSPSRECAPSPSHECAPSPSSECAPSPFRGCTPSPSGECAPSPSGECAPSPSGECGPSPSGECGPSPSGECGPSPSSDCAPSPSRECTPSPSCECALSPSSECGPSPSSKCAPSSSNECRVHQIDLTEKVPRPVKLTYSRRKCLNNKLPNSKSEVLYQDPSQESMKLDWVQPRYSQENSLKNEHRKFSLCYNRKRKLETFREEKTVMVEFPTKQPTLKFVYKRKKIQADQNSPDCL